MEPNTRNWTATSEVIAALLLTMTMPFSAQGVGAERDTALPSTIVPASAGQAPQQPGLPPLAVSQIEEGRRSEAMDQPFSLSFAEPISIRELLLLLVRDTNLSVVLDPMSRAHSPAT